MSQTPLGDHYSCDRCAACIDVPASGRPRGWSRMWAAGTRLVDPWPTPPRHIGYNETPRDLCPTCSDELFAWWEAPAAPTKEARP